MKSSYRLWVLAFMLLTPLILVWAMSSKMDWQGLALNFGTEMLGALVIYILFELVIASKENAKPRKQPCCQTSELLAEERNV